MPVWVPSPDLILNVTLVYVNIPFLFENNANSAIGFKILNCYIDWLNQTRIVIQVVYSFPYYYFLLFIFHLFNFTYAYRFSLFILVSGLVRILFSVSFFFLYGPGVIFSIFSLLIFIPDIVTCTFKQKSNIHILTLSL